MLNAGTMGSAGTLTISGVLTTNAFSNLSFDLGAANTVGAGVNDLISAALTPVINGNTQITINTPGTLTVGAYTLINGTPEALPMLETSPCGLHRCGHHPWRHSHQQ